ncbi:MAG: hypothetical protein ACOX5G_01225 [Kiritimatiellia bacterium]
MATARCPCETVFDGEWADGYDGGDDSVCEQDVFDSDGAAFAAGFSLPLGRALLVLTAISLGVDVAKGRRTLRFPPVAWMWVLFVAVAFGATWHGLDPDRGLSRLSKLVWYLGIPLAASIVDSREKAWSLVRAYVLERGCSPCACSVATFPSPWR